MGGFIIGFDSDPVSIFRRQIEFIQKTGIVTAMVGLLNALPGTQLHQRLEKEGRLLPGQEFTGHNTDGWINFIPKMDIKELKTNYGKLIHTIYSPKSYYQRTINFLKNYRPSIKARPTGTELKAFFHSLWTLGVVWRFRYYYWKMIFVGIFRYPKAFSKIVSLAIYGYHFEKVSRISA